MKQTCVSVVAPKATKARLADTRSPRVDNKNKTTKNKLILTFSCGYTFFINQANFMAKLNFIKLGLPSRPSPSSRINKRLPPWGGGESCETFI